MELALREGFRDAAEPQSIIEECDEDTLGYAAFVDTVDTSDQTRLLDNNLA